MAITPIETGKTSMETKKASLAELRNEDKAAIEKILLPTGKRIHRRSG
ncbi:hypothetical protein G159_06335 [Planococcus glaciei CHR43]|nr:hypothetical protein G159_06335 [Planococcus glaciei CHR43]